MATIVVLAVCLDPLNSWSHGAVWNSGGYIFLAANSINEAIHQFKAGDFDLVLLGHSIPEDARERLTFLIRATGAQVPVVRADATFWQDSNELLTELLKDKAKVRMAAFQYDAANREAVAGDCGTELIQVEKQRGRGKSRQAVP